MARCFGGPYGTIRGSIGNLTFSYRKGSQFVYLKQDYTPSPARQPVGFKNAGKMLSLTMRVYHLLRPELYKYWQTYKRNMMEHSSFIRQNLGAIFQTIPDRKQPITKDNWVDLSKMELVYNGRIYEPKMKIENLTYDSNRLHLKWHTGVWRDGKPDDTAHIIVLYCIPSNEDIKVPDCLYTSYPDAPPQILNSILSDGTSRGISRRSSTANYELKIFYNKSVREQGEATILIDENLNPKFLSTFLFFSNNITCSDISGAALIRNP
ncbi:MAG: hypothetical protein WC614_05970 [bacterium]